MPLNFLKSVFSTFLTLPPLLCGFLSCCKCFLISVNRNRSALKSVQHWFRCVPIRWYRWWTGCWGSGRKIRALPDALAGHAFDQDVQEAARYWLPRKGLGGSPLHQELRVPSPGCGDDRSDISLHRIIPKFLKIKENKISTDTRFVFTCRGVLVWVQQSRKNKDVPKRSSEHPLKGCPDDLLLYA